MPKSCDQVCSADGTCCGVWAVSDHGPRALPLPRCQESQCLLASLPSIPSRGGVLRSGPFFEDDGGEPFPGRYHQDCGAAAAWSHGHCGHALAFKEAASYDLFLKLYE